MSTNIYILKCEEGKYYVGKTDNINKRFEQHVNGKGSEWTKKYKPIFLEEKIMNASPFDEDKYTKIYMSKYGIENVRGGSYTSIELSEEDEDILRKELRAAKDACYKCGKSGHFANRCTKKSSFTGICGCGRQFLNFEEYMSHQRMCIPRRQEEIDETSSSEDEEEEWECEYCDRTFTTEYGCMVHERSCKEKQSTSTKNSCYKCGRKGHWANNCYARRHINGKYLDE